MEARDIYRLFGQRVAAQRDERGLKQQELGAKVGLSRASIANIEAGRQRVLLHQALALAGALGVRSLSDLFPLDLLKTDRHGPENETTLQFSGSAVSKHEAANLARIVELLK